MAETLTVFLPEETVIAIKALSSDPEGFVLDVIQREIIRRRQIAGLREAAGLWLDRDDLPDAPAEIVEFVRRLRAEEDQAPQ